MGKNPMSRVLGDRRGPTPEVGENHRCDGVNVSEAD